MIDAGFNKAPFDYEEVTSSGSLKAIERSPVTRYFDEPNNGRRLGAASYRTGLYAERHAGRLLLQRRRHQSGAQRVQRRRLKRPDVDGPAASQTASTADEQQSRLLRLGRLRRQVHRKRHLPDWVSRRGYLPDQGGPGSTVGAGQQPVALRRVHGHHLRGCSTSRPSISPRNDPSPCGGVVTQTPSPPATGSSPPTTCSRSARGRGPLQLHRFRRPRRGPLRRHPVVPERRHDEQAQRVVHRRQLVHRRQRREAPVRLHPRANRRTHGPCLPAPSSRRPRHDGFRTQMQVNF